MNTRNSRYERRLMCSRTTSAIDRAWCRILAVKAARSCTPPITMEPTKIHTNAGNQPNNTQRVPLKTTEKDAAAYRVFPWHEPVARNVSVRPLGARCIESGARFIESGARCIESGARCTESVYRCTLHQVRCTESGVRCMLRYLAGRLECTHLQMKLADLSAAPDRAAHRRRRNTDHCPSQLHI